MQTNTLRQANVSHTILFLTRSPRKLFATPAPTDSSDSPSMTPTGQWQLSRDAAWPRGKRCTSDFALRDGKANVTLLAKRWQANHEQAGNLIIYKVDRKAICCCNPFTFQKRESSPLHEHLSRPVAAVMTAHKQGPMYHAKRQIEVRLATYTRRRVRLEQAHMRDHE